MAERALEMLCARAGSRKAFGKRLYKHVSAHQVAVATVSMVMVSMETISTVMVAMVPGIVWGLLFFFAFIY